MAVKKKNASIVLGSTQETTVPENDIQDINLSITGKKRFRIDGDNNRIIYLNTSDFNIIGRFEEMSSKISELLSKHFSDVEDDEDIALSKFIEGSDKEMRNLVDYVFNSKVADVCAPDGTMFDLFNGEFRFEHIFNTLLTLYNKNMETEINRMRTNLSRYTRKYTKKG